MERATGIEPVWPAWKAGALPLSYARPWWDSLHLLQQRAVRLSMHGRTRRPGDTAVNLTAVSPAARSLELAPDLYHGQGGDARPSTGRRQDEDQPPREAATTGRGLAGLR